MIWVTKLSQCRHVGGTSKGGLRCTHQRYALPEPVAMGIAGKSQLGGRHQSPLPRGDHLPTDADRFRCLAAGADPFSPSASRQTPPGSPD